MDPLVPFGHTRLGDSEREVEHGQGILPHCCERCAVSHVWTDSKPNSRDVLRVTQEAKHTGTEHVNLAADDWADESLEENHEV